MMTYEKAELELVRFAAEDVLATSPAGEETDAVVTTTKCGGAEDIVLPPIEFE